MKNTDREVYFIGGGLASLAGAAYLIRDCNMDGKNIHVLEEMHILGGSNDGIGTPENGFVCRGGRMLNKETYENFWELFYSIPSIYNEGKSVSEEIIEFDHAHPTHSNARLVNGDGYVEDVLSMGFDKADRMAMGKLLITPEEKLDDLKICDWFGPHLFETNFWYMWQTTFAFQSWSSLYEFRRYMNRMIFEFSRIQTLEGVARTPYNQYDSIILPLKAYLDKAGVDFTIKCTVTDLDFAKSEEITVTAIHYKDQDQKVDGIIQLQEGDLCIMTNGCITDCASLGDLHTPPEYKPENPVSFDLWAKVANKKRGLGNPKPFVIPQETNWESITITSNGNKLLKMIEKVSRNIPGSGALMTFKDSSWRMSLVVAAQPHFVNQPDSQTIFWAYGLFTDKTGDYIKKSMGECTGQEIFLELLYHLSKMDENFMLEKEEILNNLVNVIPCMMPYVDALFQPHRIEDRPQVVPAGSTNFGMISQFVEMPKDMVFTEEYSVRAARTAVYTLMDVGRPVCPVTPHAENIYTLMNALITSYR